MTDIHADTSPASKPDNGLNPAASKPPSAPPKRGRKGGALVPILVIVVLIALALGAALWAQRKQFMATGQQVASRLDEAARELRQAREESRQALTLAQSQAAQLADLETRIRDVQSQGQSLQQALESLNSSTSDEIVLNDVERLVTLASQQLRLAGNVSNAIVALESAQDRLAQADRPNFASLQQSINGDLDRLRAVSVVDVAAQSSRIDRLSALVGKAPLLVPDSGAGAAASDAAMRDARREPMPIAPDPAADLPADASWWQRWRAEMASWPGRAGATIAHEFGGLISIQRADAPAALLLSSEQADQLRAMLRQRLLTVQLAMLMRQQSIWSSELLTVQDTLSKYFDTRSPDTQSALALTRELAAVQIDTRVPDVSDSLSNLAAARAASQNQEDGQG